MITKQLTVENELGLHARVASRIVRETRAFQSTVRVRKDDRTFDLKNVTGVIMVNGKRGDVLTVEFDGADEVQACEAVTALFADKFGEK